MIIQSREHLLEQMRRKPALKDSRDPKVEELMAELARLAAMEDISVCLLQRTATVKSPRRAALTRQNEEATIRQAMRLAFDRENITDEAIRISILTALHGVSVPTASAILSWREPEHWGVVDFRTWQVMNGAQMFEPAIATDGRAKSRNEFGVGLTPRDWADYIREVKALANELKWQPQQIDQWMFRWHERHQAAYPRRPVKQVAS